ncbi:hypothetical protein Rleg10DRAFT_5630 [Rhizobium leguminosarum bv. trifolii WSM2012]|nr:hypothetical protein Rleg10DRAFT_4356 [Rhizobium leguminosarum bv. trifolii WSM2012]EJC76938.1 hypothetical protein Rleg10DRAFT_5630 [Rhizobium leguminosarum bv. trifolii WSM2012]
MPKLNQIRTEFVKRIPKALDDGFLYISEEFGTAAHNCCCGCGVKIVTPIKPGKWEMRNDGGIVSLHPSIGNWSSACQSHYVISRNLVRWERTFSEAEIQSNREHDQRVSAAAHAQRQAQELGFFGRMWVLIKRWFGF